MQHCPMSLRDHVQGQFGEPCTRQQVAVAWPAMKCRLVSGPDAPTLSLRLLVSLFLFWQLPGGMNFVF